MKLNDFSIVHSIGQFIIYFYLPKSERVSENKSGKKQEIERTNALSFKCKYKWIEKKTYWMWNKRWVNAIHNICYKSKIKMKSLACVYVGKRKWLVH